MQRTRDTQTTPAAPYMPAAGRALAGYLLTDTLVRQVYVWPASDGAGFYFALTQVNRHTESTPGGGIFYGVHEPISWSMVLSEIEKFGDFDRWTERAVDATLAEGELMDCHRAVMWRAPDGQPRRGWDDQPCALSELPSIYETLNERFRGEADHLAAMLGLLEPADALTALMTEAASHNEKASTLIDNLSAPQWPELLTAVLERMGVPTIQTVEFAALYAQSIWSPWQDAGRAWARLHGETHRLEAYLRQGTPHIAERIH